MTVASKEKANICKSDFPVLNLGDFASLHTRQLDSVRLNLT